MAGIGNNYSSFGLGIKSVLWNPAGLMKTNMSEAYLSGTTTAPAQMTDKKYNVEDNDVAVSGSGSTGNSFVNRVLFTNDLHATNKATREFDSPTIYAPQSSGLTFKQAIKVNDSVALGITSRGETEISADLSGQFPAQFLSKINLYNTNNFMGSGISVGSNGKMSYSYSPSGSTPYIYTSEASVWGGFLSQEARIPFSVLSEVHNNINMQSDLTFTGASKWNSLSYGVNFTPISASLNVDNTAKAIVNSGTTDPYFYVPNYNPNDQSDVLQWMTDPSRYGTEAGYRKVYSRVPEGESIAEAKYSGFFNASTIRSDFGLIYDFGDNISLGAEFENFNGAALNFKGTGQVAYANTRINTSTESGSIIDPSKSTTWSPFVDSFTSLEGIEGLGMSQSFNVNLPQRIKYGITFRKPWLITLDYETQLNPIPFRCKDINGNVVDASLNNLKIIRGGMETQVFILPWWLRGSMSIMLKPDLVGLDQISVDKYNKAFLLKKFLPLSLELSSTENLWGYYFTQGGGFDASTAFSLIQLDTMNTAVGKILYYTFAVNKDYWHVVYQNALDPVATAIAVGNAPESDRKSNDAGKILALVKWISTLTIGYSF